MIRLEKISKSFDRPDGQGRLTVLDQLDLEVSRGELMAIVGASGTGKSTLLNILGLLDRADGGRYTLDGDLVSELESKELASIRNRKIGFVFQQFHLLPRATALENVELPLVYSTSHHPQTRAADALCKVGLEDRLLHYPSELSGGQQQRVALARAIVNQPDLVLADEPTGNLDPEASDEIMSLLEQLNQGGTTILIITHDHAIAQRARTAIQIVDGGCRST